MNKYLTPVFSFSLSPPVCPQFSDNYYRADLIEALTNSLTPAISINNEVRTVDNLNADVRLILEEITRFLNMEKLLPSFRNTITVRLGVEWSVLTSILVTCQLSLTRQNTFFSQVNCL